MCTNIAVMLRMIILALIFYLLNINTSWASDMSDMSLCPALMRVGSPNTGSAFDVPPSLRVRAARLNSTHGPTIFEVLKFGPVDGQPIVYWGWGRFIGDSLLATVSHLAAIHRLFPNSHIYHVGPTSKIIRSLSWLTPIPYSYSPLMVYSLTGPKAFWLTQNSPNNEFIKSSGLDGIDIDIRETMSGMVSTVSIRGGVAGPEQNHWLSFGQDLGGFHNKLYRGSDYLCRYLYGIDNGLQAVPELLLYPEGEAAVASFIKEMFKGEERPKYIVLNLNTFAAFKVEVMKQYYLQNLKLILGAIQRKNKKIKILLTPPEPQFGEDVIQSVRKYVSENNNVVSFLPENNKYWMSFVAQSEFVITQDSGFMHLSLIVKDPKKIFGLGHENSASDVDVWSMPGQTTGTVLGKMTPELRRWLDKN